jgi:hypothetical protein
MQYHTCLNKGHADIVAYKGVLFTSYILMLKGLYFTANLCLNEAWQM